jgi:hypothetical protein
MKGRLWLAVGAIALGSVALTDGAQAACSRVAASGEGLTKELATEMAKINLGFAIMSKGAKASGPVSVGRCSQGVLMLTACTVRQRACS